MATHARTAAATIGRGTYDALSPRDCPSDFQHLAFVQHIGACYRNVNSTAIRIDSVTARYGAFAAGQTFTVRVVTGARDGSGAVTPNLNSLVGGAPGAEQVSAPLESASTPGRDFTVSFPSSFSVAPGADFCVVFSKAKPSDPTLFLHSCPLDAGESVAVVNDPSHYAMTRSMTEQASYTAPLWQKIQTGVQIRHSIAYSVLAPTPAARPMAAAATIAVAPTVPETKTSDAAASARLPALLLALLPLLLLAL
eukprot:tig00021726_g23254.t1